MTRREKHWRAKALASGTRRRSVSLIEYHYDCPFKFTGKINQLTYTLGPHEYVAETKEEKPQ